MDQQVEVLTILPQQVEFDPQHSFKQADVVAHICNPSILEAGSQPRLHETLSPKNRERRK